MSKAGKAFRTVACCLGLVLFLYTNALAVIFPLTLASAHKAINWGRSVGTEKLVQSPTYNKTADKKTWADYTPSCRILTPYGLLAFRAAQDAVTYSNEAQGLVPGYLASHTLSVEFVNFSTELDATKFAVGVIHQDGRVIKAQSRTIHEPDVVDEPEAGYSEKVEFDFDMRTFNPRHPFVVGIADIMVVGGDNHLHVGEARCAVESDTL